MAIDKHDIERVKRLLLQGKPDGPYQAEQLYYNHCAFFEHCMKMVMNEQSYETDDNEHGDT